MSNSGDPIEIDVYARVSRVGDDRQRSTEGQVEDCEARILERGAQLGEVHVDPGRSAWNPRVRRPAWDALMERLESGATNGVVVFDLARFSRRPIEGERLIAAAERGLLVLDSEGEFDLVSASGKKAFRDQLNSAAYESDRLSTRTARGKRIKALRGEPNNGRYRPFGWEDNRVTIHESEAAELRAMARRVLDGESQDKIVADLNARGITTTSGGLWTTISLKRVLLRHRNVGEIVYRGAPVSRLSGETLLDQQMWDQLNALYASRRRGRPISDAYLCSGIAHCGRCSSTLTGRPRHGMKPYEDGSVRRQYWCRPWPKKGGCGRLFVDQRELDRHVLVLAAHILADPRHAAAIEAAGKVATDKRRALEAELEEVEQLLEELAGRLGRREMTLARHDRAAKPLEQQLAALEAELEALPLAPAVDESPELAAASLDQWKARLEAATVAEQRNLLRRALRGRRLVIKPTDPHAPRRFDPARVEIEDTPTARP